MHSTESKIRSTAVLFQFTLYELYMVIGTCVHSKESKIRTMNTIDRLCADHLHNSNLSQYKCLSVVCLCYKLLKPRPNLHMTSINIFNIVFAFCLFLVNLSGFPV